jgi:hypothetical protein
VLSRLDEARPEVLRFSQWLAAEARQAPVPSTSSEPNR